MQTDLNRGFIGTLEGGIERWGRYCIPNHSSIMHEECQKYHPKSPGKEKREIIYFIGREENRNTHETLSRKI